MQSVDKSESEVSLSTRSPLKKLPSDSPMANKKRKNLESPDCRNAKQAKIISKENEDEIQVIEEDCTENEEKNEKKSSKSNTPIETKSKGKNSTPNKGKNKKTEKVQTNLLTKFLKKATNKTDEDVKNQSSHNSEEKNKLTSSLDQEVEIVEVEKNQNNKLNLQTVTVVIEKLSEKEISENTEEKNKNQTDVYSVEKKESSENSADVKLENSMKSNGTISLSEDDVDVDSDGGSSLSDDSSKSNNDSKRTEHEDTDSKDTLNKSHQSTTKIKLNSSTNSRKVTPKQIEKKLESQKKREAREKQRLEREKKLQEERESRKKEKEDKKREREEKEKLLKEQKRIEKEQKELKKQAEIEQKQKEKEAKEESRRKREEAKEEEKKRKEEEKLEAERKKQKAASNFVSFFVAKKTTDTKSTVEEKKVEKKENFMPFEVKADMKLAPNVRRSLSDSEKSKLEEVLSGIVNISDLYIHELKSKNYTIRKSSRTWPLEANDDIVILEDDDEEGSNVVQASNSIIEKHHPKLLMFQDNRRPPYWGTWRKTSKTINPRRPFAKDTEWFDYEVDSDDEWEEEEPGESINGSDDEKDKDEDNPEDNEYDVDNDFMVPHGYLSDEEIVAEDDDDEEDDDLNPEKQKTKLELLGKQFEAERNTKTQKLKPKVIGCVWLNEKNECPEATPARTVQFLSARYAWAREIPIKLTAPAEGDLLIDECGTPSNKNAVASSIRKAKALEDAIPDLIRLLHGSIHNKNFLIKEFVAFWDKKMEGKNPIPKVKLKEKIKEIASWTPCPDPGPMHEKLVWYVAESYRTKYLPDEKLSIPNSWNYILTPKRKTVTVENTEKEEKEKKKSLITQFTKTTPVAGEKSSPVTPVGSTSKSTVKVTPTSSRQPKRATLISLPSSEPASKLPRISLIDQFRNKDDDTKEPDKSKNEDSADEDCKIIDDSD